MGAPMKRMVIKAYYNGERVAAFIDEAWARRFAIRFSLLYGPIELYHSTGIIGQYEKGLSSYEFRLHHAACFSDGQAE
jgi:hypothetical protein